MSKEKASYENVHWADNSAQRVINRFPKEKVYTLASGITPSGFIHIGNFREVITTELVRRALEKNKKKKTRFIFSLDSYDAFRKVPKDLPEEWSKYLRMPDGEVPSPFGGGSFADYFLGEFEKEMSSFEFPVEYLKQHEVQTSGVYADSIKKVLINREKVINILNKYRAEDAQLSKNWMPIDIYDDETRKDDNKILSYDENYTLKYINGEGNEKEVNFKENPRVKLRWKADWPMRWNHFKVCFEPGGKDHSTPGSSYTVGCEIIKEIFDREPPEYTMYDFVKVKGQGGKISSSKGGALRLKYVNEVYTPELVLFLFAGTRPNSELDISFDLDVIKIYEDFDKLERLYYGLEEEKNPKKLATQKRIYELCQHKNQNPQKKIPFQPSFRHLLTVAQAKSFDYKKVLKVYEDDLKTEFDKNRFKERFECCKNWIEKYAPEEMKFTLNTQLPKVSKEEREVLLEVRNLIESSKSSEDLFKGFRPICERHEISVRDFFKFMYGVIINKEKGPKLADFIVENRNEVENLLKQL